MPNLRQPITALRIASLALLCAALLTAPATAGPGAARSNAPGADKPAAPAQQRQPAQNVELVGQIGGATFAVDVVGRYAYIGVGPRLVVLDVIDPQSPRWVGQSSALPGVVRAVTVAGSYAYVATDNDNAGLVVIDVRDPMVPRQVGALDTPDFFECASVAVVGGYAYVAVDRYGLVVVDVRDPTTPRQISTINTPGSALAVTVAGGYAYVAADSGGLVVIDVRDPTAPRQTSTIDTPGSALAITIAGSYAYVASVAADFGGLVVMDVRDPTAPRQVGALDIQERVVAVTVAGDYIYAVGTSDLVVIDVRDPTAPHKVGAVETSDFIQGGVTVVGDHAYVVDRSGLVVIDVQDPTTPGMVGAFGVTQGHAYDVAVAGSYAYVAADYAGLVVMDVGDPTTPRRIGALETPGYPVGVSVAGRYAYVAAESGGLVVIDVWDPTAPRQVATLNTPGIAHDVTVMGSYAYVSCSSNLVVIDVRDPTAPRQVSAVNVPIVGKTTSSDITVAGGYAYVANGYGGDLLVIDVQDPRAPRQVGAFDTVEVDRCVGVAVAASHAYLVCGSGLVVIDIQDPTLPRQDGVFDTPSTASGIAVAGGYAYVTTWYGGLVVIDVQDPTALRLIGDFKTGGTEWGVTVSQSHIFVAAGNAGLYILRPTIPAPFDAEADTCTTATPLPPAATLPAVVQEAADIDVFALDVPAPFTQVDVTVTDATDSIDAWLFHDCGGTIGPSSGRHIGATSGRHIGGAQRLRHDVLTSTGRYHLQVAPKTASGFPINYTVRVDLTSVDPAEKRTLILTDDSRLQGEFGLAFGGQEMREWRAALQSLADDPRVRGFLITDLDAGGAGPAASIAYREWRRKPEDVNRANAVANALRDWVWELRTRHNLTNLRYLVLAGDDTVVPHFRMDISPTGRFDDGWQTEPDYMRDDWVGSGTPIGKALLADTTLSDDTYGAPPHAVITSPDVYAPDFRLVELPVGRLVERPAHMTAVVSAFLRNQGETTVQRSLAAGYSFIQDGAQSCDTALADAGLPDSRRTRILAPDWPASHLRAPLFGQRHDLAVLGMHAAHFLYETPRKEQVRSTDVLAATADPAGTVVLTMACHGGLSVPGTASDHGPAGQPLDLPEAWASRGATYVGSTGWTYGMDHAVYYQERLIAGITAGLASGEGVAIGDALVAAKRAYYQAHKNPLEPKHVKVLAGTTLYGLPMQRVRVEAGGPKQPPPLAPSVDVISADAEPAPLGPQAAARSGVAYTFDRAQMATRAGPDGTQYLAFAGQDVRAEGGEPVQPRHVEVRREVRMNTRFLPPRGAVLRAATYRDIADFRPVIERAGALGAVRRPVNQAPPVFNAPGWYPSVPVALQRFTETPGVGPNLLAQTEGALLFDLGQFHPGRRTERVYDAITLDEVYSDAADHTPPTVVWVRGQVVGGGIALEVSAADDSGIARVVVAHTDNGGTWRSTALDWDPAREHWAGRIPGGTESFVQLVDWAGNVAVDDNGGRYYSAANLSPPSVVSPATARLFLPLTLREQCRPQTLRADVVLVLDLSTSMDRPTRAGRSYLDAELDAGRQFLDVTRLGAPDGDRVAVVGFNSSAWAETGLTTSREVADLALSALRGKTGPGSRLDLGLLKAAEILTRDRGSGDGRTPVIIALTDGNVSGTTEEAVRAAARAAWGERIRVYTIGLGDATASNPADRANRVLLAACASAPEMYYEQPDAEALGGIYRQIAGTIGCMSVDFWGGR